MNFKIVEFEQVLLVEVTYTHLLIKPRFNLAEIQEMYTKLLLAQREQTANDVNP